jgi:hypothetical protein
MFITLITNDIQNIIGNYKNKLNVFFKIGLPIVGLFMLTISFIVGVGGAFVVLANPQIYNMAFMQKMLFSFLGSDLLWKFIFYNFSFKTYQTYLLLPINSNVLFGYLLLKMTSGFIEILYLMASFTFSLYLFNWSFNSFLLIFMFFLVLNINSLIIMTLKYVFSYNSYSLNYFLYLIVLALITVSLVFQFSTIQKKSNILMPCILLLISWFIGLIYTKKMMYKIMRD